MGFGAIFLGIMFLYDFAIPLSHTDSNVAYMALDIFPDFLGWTLLYFGVRTLHKKAGGLDKIRFLPIFMFVLSLLTLIKDTLLFSTFYQVSENRVTQGVAGTSIEVCVRLLEVAFLIVLFSRSSAFCRKKGEDKLALSHETTRRIAMVEGVTFTLSRIGMLLPVGGTVKGIFSVAFSLDELLFVFLVWHAAIGMVRALMRISD